MVFTITNETLISLIMTQLCLILAKMFDSIDWSWWWIMCPTLASLTAIVVTGIEVALSYYVFKC